MRSNASLTGLPLRFALPCHPAFQPAWTYATCSPLAATTLSERSPKNAAPLDSYAADPRTPRPWTTARDLNNRVFHRRDSVAAGNAARTETFWGRTPRPRRTAGAVDGCSCQSTGSAVLPGFLEIAITSASPRLPRGPERWRPPGAAAGLH